MFYGYDPTYILVIIGAILSMIASSFVRAPTVNIQGYRAVPE